MFKGKEQGDYSRLIIESIIGKISNKFVERLHKMPLKRFPVQLLIGAYLIPQYVLNWLGATIQQEVFKHTVIIHRSHKYRLIDFYQSKGFDLTDFIHGEENG
ncbi:hypothetical protein HQ45_08010 [Porphyromonas crevioricanis]|nr:hypothetical protein [Porphyromonas crevioricanis]KGN88647.1 hypothetical protein HQ45_08010 [Porphyromonas crevioricanis]